MFYLVPLHWLPGLVRWSEVTPSRIFPPEYITEITGYCDFKFPSGFFKQGENSQQRRLQTGDENNGEREYC